MAWNAGRYDVDAYASEVDTAVVDYWCHHGDPLERLLNLLALGFTAICRSNGSDVMPEMFLPYLSSVTREQPVEEQMRVMEQIFSPFKDS